tara:strand:- start:242494 stop:243696 length:1203 start_codon:yes stop_codon:yes gene_type:complete
LNNEDSGQSNHEPSGSDKDSQTSPVTRSLPRREINFRFSSRFVPILNQTRCALLASTYAAGKVAAIGTGPDGLRLSFSNFQQAMGIAAGPRGLAIGGPNLIWFLRDAGSLATRIEPIGPDGVGPFDRGYLTRESFVTGNIQIHEMGWGSQGELWVVNTLFSCLCTLHEDYSFVPRWQPSFITELAPEDRCHLNGMAMVDGKPKYVTALGTSNAKRGWRDNKSSGGVLIDVDSGETIAAGFCMPHSPEVHQGKIFLLDSGHGQLVKVDPVSGDVETITRYPGYGRGMSIHGQFAFIGMSKARETSVFGGVPICEDRSAMRCGIVVVDLLAGECVAYLEFQTGVEELFDVQVLPQTYSPVLCGPYPVEDQQSPTWVIPNSELVPGLVSDNGSNGAVKRSDRD